MALRFFFLFVLIAGNSFSQSLLIETESFEEKGGWLVDPQFVEQK